MHPEACARDETVGVRRRARRDEKERREREKQRTDPIPEPHAQTCSREDSVSTVDRPGLRLPRACIQSLLDEFSLAALESPCALGLPFAPQ